VPTIELSAPCCTPLPLCPTPTGTELPAAASMRPFPAAEVTTPPRRKDVVASQNLPCVRANQRLQTGAAFAFPVWLAPPHVQVPGRMGCGSSAAADGHAAAPAPDNSVAALLVEAVRVGVPSAVHIPCIEALTAPNSGAGLCARAA